ncbi:E3 ubiquitin/ISG15 ligase TRIM25-like [Hyperolius riggenbachi]|uniref:E3 ubiquitin/ISG15 ligase TRIM25-like n=1 Tax=Hyperolius riggenbachi TaxID=752182 RepID=UPI0035A39CB3
MTSCDLSKEMECPVCLTVYTDPVNLKCGHNFCQDCIDQHLDTQEDTGGDYSCPACRTCFYFRPALQKNITLRNIADWILSCITNRQMGVLCTYCVDVPDRAVMTCLHCDADLCLKHLKVHSRTPEHVLHDIDSPLEHMKCSNHNKLVEYYCEEEDAFICVYCSVEEHRGHPVKTLVEASKRKKELLRNDIKKLEDKTEETDKRIEKLEECKRQKQVIADDEAERVSTLFKDLKKSLKNLETTILSDIVTEAEQVSLSYDYDIIDYESKKKELSNRMEYIEDLCNTADPLTLLQEPDVLEWLDSLEEDHEDGVKLDEKLDNGRDLDMEKIYQKFERGLFNILCDINVRREEENGPSAEDEADHPWPLPRAVKAEDYAELQDEESDIEEDELSSYVNIFLDADTAGNHLHIPYHKRVASSSVLSHDYPETPQRFLHDPQVLSVQSFSSGQHHWDVKVEESKWWRIGLCYPSIDRRGDHSVIGCNEKSWSLCWSNNRYSVVHDNKVTRIGQGVRAEIIRVYLDYDAMQISFYAQLEPPRRLHTFNTTFTEPLHFALWVASGYVEICKPNEDEEDPPTDYFTDTDSS